MQCEPFVRYVDFFKIEFSLKELKFVFVIFLHHEKQSLNPQNEQFSKVILVPN